MKYLNTGLVCEQSGLSCVELPKICIPVYREVIKEMAEVIKDSQMRDVFYSLSTGIDILAVSKKTGVTPRNLAYMYKKASRQVRLEWKSYSEWKQELDRVYILSLIHIWMLIQATVLDWNVVSRPIELEN